MNTNMTILLYDYHELEQRASSRLRVWKAWHTIIYILIAITGIVNYIFLQNTMQLVDDNCVLYPRKLEFHWVHLPDKVTGIKVDDDTSTTVINENVSQKPVEAQNVTNNVTDAQNTTVAVPENATTEKAKITKRDVTVEKNTESIFNETTVDDNNATIITENATSRLMLNTMRSLFSRDSDCEFAEYMPLMSAVFGILWATLFIMCPGGGRTTTSSGLQQSWRILTPALLFAIVLVGLTGHSFATTNAGLQAFCAAFYEITNDTSCSSVNPYVEKAWNASWGVSGRVAATRAAAAGAWVTWACAAALLMARCLAAPDFVVRRTGAYLKDPQQKLTPHLKKSPRRSVQSSPSKRDTVSVKSEPTTTTELVTASVEHDPDSEPTSLVATPVKLEKIGEAIEMTYNPQELNDHR